MSRTRNLQIYMAGFLEFLVIFSVDILSIMLLYKVSVLIRVDVLPMFYTGFPEEFPFTTIGQIWWVFLVWAFIFYYEGLYTRRFALWDEVRTVCKAVFFSSIGVFVMTSVGKMDISRTVIVLHFLLGLFIMPFIRIGAKRVLRKMGLLKRRVLILGAGTTGRMIARTLQREINFGYEVVGFLDDNPAMHGEVIDGVKVHRYVDSAHKYLERAKITDLIIAMPGAGKERLQELVNKYQHKVDSLLFIPDVFGVAVVGTSLIHFFDEQAFAVEMKNNLSRPLNYAVKRAFDYVTGVILLLLFALPLLVIAIAIKMDSPGPVFFGHMRVGRHGQKFRCCKFRTMYMDAAKRLEDLLRSDPALKAEWEEKFKLSNDPRVTRVGRFLRITSLDELPQLFNVIVGTMSIVGPRPVTQDEIDKYYKENAELCFGILPGITGLWQVSGRSNLSYDYRIALDCWYVRNWNLWLDIVVLIKTLGVVLRREGAV